MLGRHRADPERYSDNWRWITAEEGRPPLPDNQKRDHEQEPDEREQERTCYHYVPHQCLRIRWIQRQVASQLCRKI